MPREELQRASDALRAASESAEGEPEERLSDQSDQIAELASAERDPDQGRLARHLNVLNELRGQSEGEVAERIAEAREALTDYRSGVGGV